jgi:hypothetical protein
MDKQPRRSRRIGAIVRPMHGSHLLVRINGAGRVLNRWLAADSEDQQGD